MSEAAAHQPLSGSGSNPDGSPDGSPDGLLYRYQKHHEYLEIALTDGTTLRERVASYNLHYFRLEDGRVFFKLAVIGVFPREGQDLILRRDHPVVPIARKTAERPNYLKAKRLDSRFMKCTLRLLLANGWEVGGVLKNTSRWILVLKARERGIISLYRHGIVDAWVEAAPPGKSLEYLSSILTAPLTPTPSSSPASPKPAPVRSTDVKDPWPKLVAKERVSVNAKLKMTLQELPAPQREVGDFFWYAMKNEPKGVPAGITLSAGPLDVLISKKLLKNAQKKAQELKQAGQSPVYLLEAFVGVQEGRLAAVASGLQVVAGKAPTEQKSNR
jgi:sRNA-binding regulator protein Hfq